MTPISRFNERIATRDGIELSADTYRPEQAEPVPAIVARTPYGKNTQEAYERAARAVGRGYAFVWNDVRGRGDSDGAFVPYRNEARDGYDVIQWTSAQEWSNGQVALWGWSYFGLSNWLTALEQPPALRAMVVRGTPSEPFVDAPTGTAIPMYVCWHRIVDGRMTQLVDQIDWDGVYWHLPLVDMDRQAGFFAPHWHADQAHPLLGEYWQPLCYQRRLEEIDIPTLNVTGWYDDCQLAAVTNFQATANHTRSEDARQRHGLLVGPWGHDAVPRSRLGAINFAPEAVIDLDEYELDWLDDCLRSPEAGRVPRARVRFFQMPTDGWRDDDTWPPANARKLRLFLRGPIGSSGMLTDEAPHEEPPDVYVSDPANPVPYITDPVSLQIGGPDDYSNVAARDDVLSYETASLEQPLRVAGPVTLRLYGSSDAPDTDFMAMLLDGHPGGMRQRLCDGMVRARYREGMDRVAFLSQGEVYAFDLNLWHIAHTFEVGHRVMIHIASTAFPKYDRNANTGGPLATETELVRAKNSVWHDRDFPSHLTLWSMSE